MKLACFYLAVSLPAVTGQFNPIPCPNCENPCFEGAVGADLYHPHCSDPTQYIQCSQWGRCFERSCPGNLLWNEAISTCVRDDNECDLDPCDENASCTNTLGSFTCECNEGFVGDGFTCEPEALCEVEWTCRDPIERCDDGSSFCLCDIDSDGIPFCWEDEFCSQVSPCPNGNADCPSGFRCVSTCCGPNVCFPECSAPDARRLGSLEPEVDWLPCESGELTGSGWCKD